MLQLPLPRAVLYNHVDSFYAFVIISSVIQMRWEYTQANHDHRNIGKVQCMYANSVIVYHAPTPHSQHFPSGTESTGRRATYSHRAHAESLVYISMPR